MKWFITRVSLSLLIVLVPLVCVAETIPCGSSKTITCDLNMNRLSKQNISPCKPKTRRWYDSPFSNQFQTAMQKHCRKCKAKAVSAVRNQCKKQFSQCKKLKCAKTTKYRPKLRCYEEKYGPHKPQDYDFLYHCNAVFDSASQKWSFEFSVEPTFSVCAVFCPLLESD